MRLRRVGKGALAPCPPPSPRMEWWARGACHLARIRATRWLCPPYATASSIFQRAIHHPGYAELIDAHAKALGEEGLAERHIFAAAFAQRLEPALGLGGIADGDRDRKALRLVETIRRRV